MREKSCFNMHKGGKSCKALVVNECPVNCTAKITDPEKYIEMLEHLMFYNIKNGNLVSEYRKEIDSIRHSFNLDEPQYWKDLRAGKYADWEECYYDSIKRRPGKGGGSSEKNTNAAKPRENDNRVLDTRWKAAEREEIQELTKQWEEDNGEKLEKLGYTSMGRSKVDTYTGEPIK